MVKHKRSWSLPFDERIIPDIFSFKYNGLSKIINSGIDLTPDIRDFSKLKLGKQKMYTCVTTRECNELDVVVEEHGGRKWVTSIHGWGQIPGLYKSYYTFDSETNTLIYIQTGVGISDKRDHIEFLDSGFDAFPELEEDLKAFENQLFEN